ncbi:hypothetical protein KFL_002400010 [Klebsormidium nitens]|uniref:Uncharacterized protein n=1 Tax=Klebsormidium nitens TaxID=105231 RepID=A0A1Y1I7X4_KLENI|nr:hypothetical protein KFL_002400010 [Klebsormidium nitens]|eukprot:GAQ85529.1 hypothetical protein KFL_002400010 [Klebsormidium nitens]
MASWFSNLVATLGFFLLGHCAYATIGYREGLKLAEKEYNLPPSEILLELLVATAILVWSSLEMGGPFAPIKVDAASNRLVKLPELMDFCSVNHRGRGLPAFLEPSGGMDD